MQRLLRRPRPEKVHRRALRAVTRWDGFARRIDAEDSKLCEELQALKRQLAPELG
jgi:hypothetical protein